MISKPVIYFLTLMVCCLAQAATPSESHFDINFLNPKKVLINGKEVTISRIERTLKKLGAGPEDSVRIGVSYEFFGVLQLNGLRGSLEKFGVKNIALYDPLKAEERPLYPYLRFAPVYPESKSQGEVTVTVVFEVDELGLVKNPKVVSESQGIFDKEALKAISQWKFIPRMENGKAVSTKTKLPMIFKED